MNPFELQAQFTRQWFDLMQTMTTTALNAYASMNEQATALWTRSMPWPAPTTSFQNPFSLPWMPNATSFAPAAFSTPFATSPWQSNPFAPWLSLFTGQTAGLPTAPTLPMLPFAPAIAQFWTPWAFMPTAATTAWTSPFSAPSRNPGADLLEQMATNYRTASGYAVAAVIGPLNAALDPRTYGEPWWQKLEKPKKLN